MQMEVRHNTFFNRYSWPLGITLVLIAFMAMTLGFVKKAFSERVDLVAPDYYYRDKLFSDRLIREKNLKRHGSFEVARNNEGVEILLPRFFADKQIKGMLHFYSPLDPADDFSLAVDFIGNRKTITAQLDAGKIWRIALDFASGSQTFFGESVLRSR